MTSLFVDWRAELPERLWPCKEEFTRRAGCAGGHFIGDVEWLPFRDVSVPGVWSRIHDEGVQVLENIANIRVPVIAAVGGRAHTHSDHALLASVIVAAEGATFEDVGHQSRVPQFVEATGRITFAEIAPDPNDYPGAMPQYVEAGLSLQASLG